VHRASPKLKRHSNLLTLKEDMRLMSLLAWCRPESTEYLPYYEPYLSLVGETDMLEGMETQARELREILDSIPEPEAQQIHSPYTWTIKQVIGHVIDNERVFAYRAMRFAVGDSTDLPGYEQDDYIANGDFENVTLAELVDELSALRVANLAMFRRFKPSAWSNSGTADGKEITVRAIACLQIGHMRHHLNIIKKRVAV